MPCDDIQSLNRIFGDLVKVTRQGFQQHLKTDHRHPLQRHLERLIFTLTRQSHLQIHLKMREREEDEDTEGRGRGKKGKEEIKDERRGMD